jgi:hypothetical protein
MEQDLQLILKQAVLGAAKSFILSQGAPPPTSVKRPVSDPSAFNRPSPPPSESRGGRTLLTDMEARGDPLLSIDWTAAIIESGNPEPIPSIYIETIQIPAFRIENKPIYRQGSMINYAGTYSVDNSSMTLYNDDTGRALKFALSWLDSVYSLETGNYRKPSDYKKNIKVILFDVAKRPVARVDLIGCWPTAMNQLQLENSTAGQLPITIDLSVDTCIYSEANLPTSSNNFTPTRRGI